MKTNTLLLWSLPVSWLLALTAQAAEAPVPTASTWHAQSLGQALGYMLIFALVGILAAIAGFKLFDAFTPGSLAKEILDNKNVAAAIVAGAVILGVCFIVAAAIFG